MVITKINDECLPVNNKNYKAMRRIITTIILSLFLMSGTCVAFADKHHKHHDKDRYEYRYDRKHSSKHHKHHYDDDDDYYKHLKKARKAEKKYWKERRKIEHKYHKDYDRQLRKMVAYAARGGRDVRVWRVSDDTYVVKYLRGGRYYTQRLYPYSGRYGSRGVVNVNWNPLSSWTLLPSININIPLD